MTAPGRPGLDCASAQEDFCQVRGVASANKYETHGGPGMLQCLQVLQHGGEPARIAPAS
nr:hypothetical protein [Delftia sp.]